MTADQAKKTDSRLAARCAAVASVGAAAIHFGVTPAHWRDWWPSGVFFASMAVFQLVWAFVAWSRPNRVVLAGGIVANAGAAMMWAVSRTAGAPFGPYAGQPEAVDAAGICVLLLQCYVVMGAAWAWSRRYRAEQVSGFGRATVLAGAGAVMAAAVTAGLASGLVGHQHHHHGVTEAEGEHPAAHDAYMESHHHSGEPADSANSVVPQPSTAPAPDGSGLPPAEMGFEAGDDGHHPGPADPSAGEPEHSTAPADEGLPVTDMGLHADAHDDGHDHGHD